jgi:rhomboid protease GluP
LNRGWRIAALAVLVVSGVSWIVKPEMAGFLGGGAWLVLLVAPSLGLRKAAELVAQQRYSAAWRLARALRFLHPADGLREQSEMLRALEFAQRGDVTSAQALLASLSNSHTNTGRQAIAQSFRIRGDWNGLVAWFHELPPGIRQSDFALQPLYLRALGETGARDELFLAFTANAKQMIAAVQHAWLYDISLLPVLAFGGRLEALAHLLETKLGKLSRETKEFWLATGELAAGKTTEGRARLEILRAATSDALIRTDVSHRLGHANEIARAPISPAAEALAGQLERIDRPQTRVFSSSTRPTTVVLILIALNVAMFLAEIRAGGSTNPLTLQRLGALEFVAVRWGGEYWRLLTSLFLHYGPLHLIFNLYALFIIGPGLEQAIGSIRFGICYLLAGLGSGIGVLLLHTMGWNSAEQLVGASGCVMGLVGVWAGLLLRHRDAPLAGRRLKNILVIVAIQTAFDLSTPQISMGAHMSGLLTGFALGLILAPRSLRAG